MSTKSIRWYLQPELWAFLIFMSVVIYLIYKYRNSSVAEFTFGKKIRFGKKRKKIVKKFENRCREILERIYKRPSKSIRPSWLKNPATDQNLEIDIWFSDIITPLGKGLAVEYDGQQHAKYVPYFHKKGPQEFIYQMKKDKWKDMMCKKQGVLLIRIPHNVDYTDLDSYIIKRLKQEKVYPK